MADSAVRFLLDNLKQLVAYNADLIVNVKGEVEGLISDLAILKGFIEESAEMGCRHKVVEELVITRIRPLTYKAEDAIEAFVAEATVHNARRVHQRVFHGFDHAAKLREVSKKVQTAREEARTIYQNPMFGFQALQRRDPAVRSRTERRPNVEKDNVVGFEEAIKTLTDRLTGETEDLQGLGGLGKTTLANKVYTASRVLIDRLTGKPKDLQVISLIGMGGLGKTTLANKVYNDPGVSHKFSSRAWIYVSQTYSRKDLFLSILKGVNKFTSDMSDMGEDKLAEKVSENLTWKYLIVVDDVWEKKDWDSIKMAFPNCRNGSRILLTSRNETVAVHADPHSPPYKLKFLTTPQSWDLLQMKVFGRGQCPRELKPFGWKIAKRCKGLPLALVVIAGMLQDNISQGWWETVAKSVNAFIVENREGCMEVLALSYHHLPDHLKPCFLYFGVFPEDYEIPVWILIRLWIAERLVQKKENLSLEEMAEVHLEDLVARNLVLVEQKSFSGRIKTCRIHDMLRDLCLAKALAEDFFSEIKGLESKSSSDSTSAVSVISRRLCIHSGVSNYILSKPSGPHVHSFLSFDKDQVNLTTEHVGYIPKKFKSLRVFHFQPILCPRFPDKIEKLDLLRYVAFSGDIKTIPPAVSNLGNLQTLIVETSSRTIDVHADIRKMLLLRHLHTNGASQLIGSVDRDNDFVNESLQTLSTITPESCTEGVLGRTRRIKKLGIRGKLAILLEEGGSLFDNLTKLEYLVTLKLFNDVYPDPPFMSKLQSLPQCYKFPPNLKRLTLADTFLDWEHMSVLGMLPELEELKLKDNAFTGVRWSIVDEGFKKLKALQIWKTNLVDWEANADHFPSLQHIVLKDCKELGSIPSSLGNVETLQTIKLHQTSASAAASAREIQQRQNRLKVDIFPPDLGQGLSPGSLL